MVSREVWWWVGIPLFAVYLNSVLQLEDRRDCLALALPDSIQEINVLIRVFVLAKLHSEFVEFVVLGITCPALGIRTPETFQMVLFHGRKKVIG